MAYENDKLYPDIQNKLLPGCHTRTKYRGELTMYCEKTRQECGVPKCGFRGYYEGCHVVL